MQYSVQARQVPLEEKSDFAWETGELAAGGERAKDDDDHDDDKDDDDDVKDDDGEDDEEDEDHDEDGNDNGEMIKGEAGKNLGQCFLPVWRLKPFWKRQSHNPAQGSGQYRKQIQCDRANCQSSICFLPPDT